MDIGKEQAPRIIRIQRPTPVVIPRRPAQEPVPATPEPVSVPVRQPAEQPAGK
jgi:hypothetical protein